MYYFICPSQQCEAGKVGKHPHFMRTACLQGLGIKSKEVGSRAPGFDSGPPSFPPLLLPACRPRPCCITRCPLGSKPGLKLTSLPRHPPAKSPPALVHSSPKPTPLCPSLHQRPPPTGLLTAPTPAPSAHVPLPVAGSSRAPLAFHRSSPCLPASPSHTPSPVSPRPERPRLPSPKMPVSARPGSGPMTGLC